MRPTHATISILAVLICALAACGTDDSADRSDSADIADRSPAEVEDSLAASCVDHCGAKSAGDCWCDDLCADIGDCCSDVGVCTTPDAVQCGGAAGIECPFLFTCIDDPDDDCAAGEGLDCAGVCAPSCAGLAGTPCPDGLECDKPPACADCPGVCRQPSSAG